MIQIDYRDSRPIYEQIMNSFKKLIQAGVLVPGEKLPSVRTIAKENSINPNTIQKAINELENQGYIYSVAGKGSFVVEKIVNNPAKIEELKGKLMECSKELMFLGVSKEEIIGMINGGSDND